MNNIINERAFLLKAILTCLLLVIIITSLLYPSRFWYLPIFGGLISIMGIGLRRKTLVTSGIILIGGIFFLSNLTIILTTFNIILLVGLFILIYGAIIYMNDMVRLDIISTNYEGNIADTFDQYRKNWNRSIFKNLSLVLLLSLLAVMISWIGSSDFWIQINNILLLGLSVLFTLIILILLYILFVKIPELSELVEE